MTKLLQAESFESECPVELERAIERFFAEKGVKEADIVDRRNFAMPDVLLSVAAGISGFRLPI